MLTISTNARWSQNGVTVAGGNGYGNAFNQLRFPYGLDIDDDNQSIVIADYWNHCIVEWKIGASNGKVIAGGQGQGNRLDQLNYPTDVLIDKETNSLFIADRWNRRVVRWSRRQETTQGEVIVDNVDCRGLAMDRDAPVPVPDWVTGYQSDRSPSRTGHPVGLGTQSRPGVQSDWYPVPTGYPVRLGNQSDWYPVPTGSPLLQNT